MYQELRESKPHGTSDCPFVYYHMRDIRHSFQIPVHWHNEMEIIYVCRGPLSVTIGNEKFSASEGSVLIVNPGELHLMSSATGGVDYYTILFPLEFISFRSNDWLENHLLLPLRSGRKRIENDTSEEFQEQAARICRKLTETACDRFSDQLSARIALLEFIRLIHTQGRILVVHKTQEDIGKDMLVYIQDNYMHDLTLQELSDHFHLSGKYISRYFSSHFQIPFSQYLRHLRLSHAEELLLSTNLSVTDIALRSGYPNVSHFIRSFRKAYMKSPLQYRKNGQTY